jgi:tRNA-dihydrouridine synthase A
MIPYIEQVISSGGRVHDVTRHMLGLFWGLPGAGLWRKMLSGGRGLAVEDYVNALYAVQVVQQV